MDKKYRFKKGSRLTGDAQAVGETFEQMSASVGLTATNVVAAAKDRNSILHPFFTWDKKAGFEKNLQAEAQRLIASVEVFYITVKHEVLQPVRAFVAVGPTERRMLPTIEVMEDEEYRQVLLNQAFNELAAFTKKYRNLKELAALFDVVDQLPIPPRIPSPGKSPGIEGRV